MKKFTLAYESSASVCRKCLDCSSFKFTPICLEYLNRTKRITNLDKLLTNYVVILEKKLNYSSRSSSSQNCNSHKQ